MSDLISRQVAIDAIMSVPDGNWTSERYADEIKSIPSAEPKCGNPCKDYMSVSEWIPVSKELPPTEEPVLVTQSGKTFFSPFGVKKDMLEEIEETSAWMPLPEPYKGGEE